MTDAALRRDEVTRAGYVMLASFAWFLYGFGAILPLLRAEQHTSRTVLGLHSLALSVGGLAAGTLAVPLVRRIRRRGVLVTGGLLLGSGVVGLAAAPVPALSIAAVAVAGIGGSMLVNTATPMLSDHHGRHGAATLSEGNALAAGVGLLSPLAVGGAVALGWSWRPAALLVLGLVGLLLVLARRVPARTAALDAGIPTSQHRAGRLPRAFWPLLALVISTTAIEFTSTQWSADLLASRTGLSAAAAAAGLTTVVAGMALGRVVVGRLAVRFSSRRLLLGALAVTLIGWTVTWTATAPLGALIGLAITGLGIAGHFPLGAALLLASAPGRPDAASGTMSIGISVAAGLAPFSLGALADATSTHTAFLVVPVLIGSALAALGLSSRAGNVSPAVPPGIVSPPPRP